MFLRSEICNSSYQFVGGLRCREAMPSVPRSSLCCRAAVVALVEAMTTRSSAASIYVAIRGGWPNPAADCRPGLWCQSHVSAFGPVAGRSCRPPRADRAKHQSYDKDVYKARNLVERMWCCLKDWRRINTRYDKLTSNFLSAVHLRSRQLATGAGSYFSEF